MPILIQYNMAVYTPSGGMLQSCMELRQCPLHFGDIIFYFDLLVLDFTVLDFTDFDIILGMNWLSANYAIVDYHNSVTTFKPPGFPICTFIDISRQVALMISVLQAKRLLNDGCQGLSDAII